MARNRRHFLVDCGRQVASRLQGQEAPGRLLAFGTDPNFQAFRESFESAAGPIHAGAADLVSVPDAELEGTVAAAVAESEAQRQLALVQRAIEQEGAGGRGSVGQAATQEALERGQVEHLLLDRSMPPALSDPLVHSAFASGAHVTLASGAAGEMLALHDGVAALLRYGDNGR